LPQAAKIARNIKVGERDFEAKFELGTVEVGPGKQLQVGGNKVRKAIFEAGNRKVTVVDEAGTHTVTVNVKAGGTVVAN
jgi:hypothetical protein